MSAEFLLCNIVAQSKLRHFDVLDLPNLSLLVLNSAPEDLAYVIVIIVIAEEA